MKQSRTHTKLIADHEKLKGEYDDLKEEIDERDKLIKALKDKIKKLSRGGRKNSSRKAEVNKDVEKAVTQFAKEQLFRAVKFMPSPENVEHVASLVWKGIKDEKKLEKGANPLDEQEFIDIYAHVVKKAISTKRQYLQVRGGKAANGK